MESSNMELNTKLLVIFSLSWFKESGKWCGRGLNYWGQYKLGLSKSFGAHLSYNEEKSFF
jgi:hypothetical protein